MPSFPGLQGLAERLEPPRLRRSLSVGGVQRLFRRRCKACHQSATSVLGRAWLKGFLAEVQLSGCAVGDESQPARSGRSTQTDAPLLRPHPPSGPLSRPPASAVTHRTQALPGGIVQRNRSRDASRKPAGRGAFPCPGAPFSLAHPEHRAIKRQPPLSTASAGMPSSIRIAFSAPSCTNAPGRTHRSGRPSACSAPSATAASRPVPGTTPRNPSPAPAQGQGRSLPGGKGTETPELADQAEPRIRRKHRSPVAPIDTGSAHSAPGRTNSSSSPTDFPAR